MKTLGQIAFEAFHKAAWTEEHRWSSLSKAMQRAWEEAAAAVSEEIGRRAA